MRSGSLVFSSAHASNLRCTCFGSFRSCFFGFCFDRSALDDGAGATAVSRRFDFATAGAHGSAAGVASLWLSVAALTLTLGFAELTTRQAVAVCFASRSSFASAVSRCWSFASAGDNFSFATASRSGGSFATASGCRSSFATASRCRSSFATTWCWCRLAARCRSWLAASWFWSFAARLWLAALLSGSTALQLVEQTSVGFSSHSRKCNYNGHCHNHNTIHFESPLCKNSDVSGHRQRVWPLTSERSFCVGRTFRHQVELQCPTTVCFGYAPRSLRRTAAGGTRFMVFWQLTESAQAIREC